MSLSSEEYACIPETILPAASMVKFYIKIKKYFQSIFLIQVGKQILMHSLSCDFSIVVFLVKFKLWFINFINCLLELLESEVSIASSCRIVALQIMGIFYRIRSEAWTLFIWSKCRDWNGSIGCVSLLQKWLLFSSIELIFLKLGSIEVRQNRIIALSIFH